MWGLWSALPTAIIVAHLASRARGARPREHGEPPALHVAVDPHGPTSRPPPLPLLPQPPRLPPAERCEEDDPSERRQPTEDRVECRDSGEDCQEWAIQGLCSKAIFRSQCHKSCGQCPDADGRAEKEGLCRLRNLELSDVEGRREAAKAIKLALSEPRKLHNGTVSRYLEGIIAHIGTERDVEVRRDLAEATKEVWEWRLLVKAVHPDVLVETLLGITRLFGTESDHRVREKFAHVYMISCQHYWINELNRPYFVDMWSKILSLSLTQVAYSIDVSLIGGISAIINHYGGRLNVSSRAQLLQDGLTQIDQHTGAMNYSMHKMERFMHALIIQMKDISTVEGLEQILQVLLPHLNSNGTRKLSAGFVHFCLNENQRLLYQLAPDIVRTVVKGTIDHIADQDHTVRSLCAECVGLVFPFVRGDLEALHAHVNHALKIQLHKEEDERVKRSIQIALMQRKVSLSDLRRARNLMQARLSEQVGRTVEVNDAGQVCFDSGVMLVAVNGTREGVEAHHCPNRKACAKGRSHERACWEWRSLHNKSTLEHLMCAKGYNPRVPGCAGCLPGFGRSRVDPFRCSTCTSVAYSWGKEVFVSTAMFAASLKSISAGKRDETGRLLNIFISFSFSAFTVHNILRDSPAYTELMETSVQWVQRALDVTALVTSSGTGTDCMGVAFGDSFAMRVALVSLAPILLLLVATGVELFRSACWSRRALDTEAEAQPTDEGDHNTIERAKGASEGGVEEDVKEPGETDDKATIPQNDADGVLETSSREPTAQDEEMQEQTLVKVMHITLVFTNIFLPGILASILLQYPCIHTQVIGKSTAWFEQSRLGWQLREPCPSTPRAPLVIGLVCTLVIGPVYWACLIVNRDRLPQRSLDFFVSSYKEDCKAWEITVLLRKMALAAMAAMVPVTYATLSHVTYAVVIMGVALAAHLYWQPYESRFLNQVEGICLLASFIAMALTIYVVTDEWSQTIFHQYVAVVVILALLVLVMMLLLSLLVYAYCQKLLAWLR